MTPFADFAELANRNLIYDPANPDAAMKARISAMLDMARGGIYAATGDSASNSIFATEQRMAADPIPDTVDHPDISIPPLMPAVSRIIPWGATVKRDFVDGVIWIEDQIGLRADLLMACMKFESNLNPQAKNPASSATGLIQFMDATAKRLGTTTAKLYAMDALTQLSYVYKYFKDYADRGHKLGTWTLEDCYMAILWPSAIGKPLDYKVFVGGTSAFKVNAGLDLNKDGFVTKQEACARVVKLYSEGLKPGNVLTF